MIKLSKLCFARPNIRGNRWTRDLEKNTALLRTVLTKHPVLEEASLKQYRENATILKDRSNAVCLKLENYFRLHFDKSCPEHASKFRESYVVRPFGSCVNGLSLHNSDLDISVTATVPQNLSGMDSQIVYEQLRDLFRAVPNRPAKFENGLKLPKLSGNTELI